MKKKITIYDYFNRELSALRWITSIFVGLMVSAIFAVQTINKRVEINKSILGALSPYLISLVDINDRTEILRVLQSVGRSENVDVVLVRNGIVMASTRSVSELDMPFKKFKTYLLILGTKFTKSSIITVESIGNANIYLIGSLRPVMNKTLFLMVISFFLCMVLSWIASLILKKVLKRSLLPLNQLHQEIKNLNFTVNAETTPIAIEEMEEIRLTIMKTRDDLFSINDKLAKEKAKQLNAQSYKQLIHDLHNPVASLRQMVRIQTSLDADDETKREAFTHAPIIAEEILLQISAAKKNLEFDSGSFEKKDLRDCVRDSYVQMNASPIAPHRELYIKLPSSPVLINHDPTTLKRAIINLLENGLEASRERVELTLEETDGITSIRVSDDGPGIDEDKITIFFQGRGLSSKANRQAYGLSSTNHIVRSHGGKIIYGKSNLGGAGIEIRLEAP